MSDALGPSKHHGLFLWTLVVSDAHYVRLGAYYWAKENR